MTTIKDVARKAGVAPSTVSYALSGKRSISHKVRRRIAKAIDALDFTPSALGRRLAHSRSNTIGLVFPIAEGELAWETMDFVPAAATVANQHNHGLSVYTTPMSGPQILKLYRENTVDGLILMQVTHSDKRVEILRNTGYPLVLVGRCANTHGLTYVDYDPEQGIYLVFEHLAQLGHTHIGYLDLPQVKRTTKLGYARFVQRGYTRALKHFDLVVTRIEIDGSIEDGARATHYALSKDPDITAIASAHGNSAMGALRTLHNHGRRVPADCSVIGISRRSWATWTSPQLTASDIPLTDMVRKATELVLQQISGGSNPASPQQILFPASITQRESCGPAPQRQIHLPDYLRVLR
jgi:DNA-binding LacI/PurR family transcriptional regulator